MKVAAANRLLWGIFLLVSIAAKSQTPIVLYDTTQLTTLTNLSPYTQVYVGGFRDSLQYADMIRGPWNVAGPGLLYASKKDFKYSVWIRLKVQNINPGNTLKLLYYSGSSDDLLTNVYSFDADSLISTFQTGWMRNATLPAWAWSADNFAIPIVVPPKSQRTFWINKLYYHARINQTFFSLMTASSYDAFKATRTWQNRWIILFLVFILGVFLFLSISGLFQFFVTKDKTYFWWAIYLWGMFFFFFRSFELYTNIRLISSIFPNYFILSLGIIQNGSQIGYFLFFDTFLKVRQYSRELHRAIRAFIGILSVFLLYSLTAFFESQLDISHLRTLLTNVIDGCTLLVVFVLLITVARKKIPLSRLMIIGSGCAYIGLFITFYMNRAITNFSTTYPWEVPSFYFGVGTLIEVFLFSLALSFRARRIEAEHNQLQRSYASNLEAELVKRTQEVQEQSTLAEEMRVRQLMSEFEQKLAETEMAALRAQMNPHFIFNCLNSIQYFTAQNDAEKASDYLTKFSRLIRLVLENSKSEKVTLENELETLRLYIEMEAMRFPQKLHYAIEVTPDIDTDSVQIPPLLLQPFVENAIWHGLMHKEEGGTVRVVVQQPQEELLRIAITDDGVGRKQAAEYRSKSATKNKSFGMKMTAERIELINQLYHTQTQIEVVDLTDSEGKAAGTKVVIDVPI